MNGYIGYAGGINLHEYVGGHSLSAVDPSGLDKNVFPLYPEVGPFPGWTGWNYNGKPYQVSPDFQGRWRNATNRSPSSEFCSYFNPQSYTADDLAKEFERGVRHWERSSKVYDCSLNPYDSETGWQMDSRAAYESGLERGMRLSNVVMTVAPLLPKFRLPGVSSPNHRPILLHCNSATTF